MSVWVSESELASRLGYKILIAGLSEAGKTAVKRIFFMKQQTQDVDSLGATINYERMAVSIAGVPITIVDLGGQRIFIKRFLSNFSPFIFSAVQVFIFLIDVAAKTTRNNSIQYFASCVEKLKTHSPDAQYFVFLHKNDLVRHLPNYESIHTQLKERFQQECSSKIHFLRTTIYKPESVIDAFGRIFEIATPQIARSEYVDGRTIGPVEEFAEKFYTVSMQDEICPNCFKPLVDSPDGLVCSFCGSQKVKIESDSTDSSSVALENLQAIMRESLTKGQAVTVEEETSPILPATGAKEDRSSAVIEKLQMLMKESMTGNTIQEPIKAAEEQITTGPPFKVDESVSKRAESIPEIKPLEMVSSVFDEELDEDLAQVVSVKSVFDEETIIDEMKSLEKTSSLEIPHLTKFYGITEKEAIALVEGGYISIFETAAKAGVPVKILLSVFFKFIPYMKDKGLSGGNNFDNRMMEVFFAHLNGLVREDEIFETIVFVANKQDMSVEQIVKKYLVKLRHEKERKKKLVEKVLAKETITLPENVIPFSQIRNIGFKAEKEDSNCRISFYHGADCVNVTVVSTRMSINELKYMVIYESELPIKGKEKEFAETAAPLIREEIYRLFKPKKIEIQKSVTIEKVEKTKKAGVKTAPPSAKLTAPPSAKITTTKVIVPSKST
ncbi:MAG: ADP-ribosylation factor-like protein, partial [Candidatus Hodarchaeales archaeon]